MSIIFYMIPEYGATLFTPVLARYGLDKTLENFAKNS